MLFLFLLAAVAVAGNEDELPPPLSLLDGEALMHPSSDLVDFLDAPIGLNNSHLVDTETLSQELQKVRARLVHERKTIADKEKIVGDEMRKQRAIIAKEEQMIAAIKKRAEHERAGTLASLEAQATADLYKLKPELKELDDALKFVADIRGMITKLSTLDPTSAEFQSTLAKTRKSLQALAPVLDFDVGTELLQVDRGCEKSRREQQQQEQAGGKGKSGEKKDKKQKKKSDDELSDKQLEEKYLKDASPSSSSSSNSTSAAGGGDNKKKTEFNSVVQANVTQAENKAIQAAEKAGKILSGADEAAKAAKEQAAKIESAVRKEEIAGLSRILDKMASSIQAKRLAILNTLNGDHAALLRAKAMGLNLDSLPAHEQRLAAAKAALAKWTQESGKIHEDLTTAIAAYNTEIARLDAILKRVSDYKTGAYPPAAARAEHRAQCQWGEQFGGPPALNGFERIPGNANSTANTNSTSAVEASAVTFAFDDEEDRGQILYGVYEDMEQLRVIEEEVAVPTNFLEFIDLSIAPVSADSAFSSEVPEESDIRFGPASTGAMVAGAAAASASSSSSAAAVPADISQWMWTSNDLQVEGGPILGSADAAQNPMMSWNEFQKDYAAKSPQKTTPAERATAYQKYKQEFAAKKNETNAAPAAASNLAPVTFAADSQVSVEKKGNKITFSNSKGQNFTADLSKGSFEVKTATPGIKLAVSPVVNRGKGKSNSTSSAAGPGFSVSVIKRTAKVGPDGKATLSSAGEVERGSTGARAGVSVKDGAGPVKINLSRKGSDIGVLINTKNGQYNVQSKLGDVGLSVQVNKPQRQLNFDLALPAGNSVSAKIDANKGIYNVGASVSGQEVNLALDKNSISVGGRAAGVAAQFYADKSGKVNVEVSQMVGVDKKTLAGLPLDANYKYGGRVSFDPKKKEVTVGGFLSGDARIKAGNVGDASATGKLNVGFGIGKRSVALTTTGNAQVGVTVAGVKLADVSADLKGKAKWSFVNGQLRFSGDNSLATKTTFLGREVQSTRVSQGGKIVTALDLASGKLNVATDGKATIESRLFGKDIVTAKLSGKATLSVSSNGKLDVNGSAGTKVSLFGGKAKMNGQMTVVTQEDGKKTVNGAVGFNVGNTGLSASIVNNKLSATFSNKHMGSISYNGGKVTVQSKLCKNDCSFEFDTKAVQQVLTQPAKRFSDRMLKPAAKVAKYMVNKGVKGVVETVKGGAKLASNFVTGAVKKLKGGNTTKKNSNSNSNNSNKKPQNGGAGGYEQVSKALNAARDRIKKDSAKLSQQFNSAMNQLKKRVTKSPEFQNAKKVYDNAKNKVSAGYSALKGKLTKAAKELQTRIKNSPVYKGAVKLGKQLHERFGQATAKIATAFKKGTPEYKEAVSKLKAKIRESELFKRGKKLATAVRSTWNQGKTRLLTAFKQSKDKVKNVVTKSKAFQAAVKFGQKTRAYVATASGKLRAAYVKASATLKKRLETVEKGIKAKTRSAARAAAESLAKKSDNLLSSFSKTVKSFDKGVASLKNVGKQIFGAAGKAVEVAAKSVKSSLAKANRLVKTGKKLVDKAAKALAKPESKKGKEAAKSDSNKKDSKKSSPGKSLTSAAASTAQKAIGAAGKALNSAKNIVGKASKTLQKVDAKALDKLKKGIAKMNKEISKVSKGMKTKPYSQKDLAKRGAAAEKKKKKENSKGKKSETNKKSKGVKGGDKKQQKKSNVSFRKDLLKLDKSLATMIKRGAAGVKRGVSAVNRGVNRAAAWTNRTIGRGAAAVRRGLSNSMRQVSQGLNTLGKHINRASSALARGAITKANGVLTRGLRGVEKTVNKAGQLGRKVARNAGRRIKSAAQRVSKQARNTMRRAGAEVKNAAKRARSAVDRSFKRLDKSIKGLAGSEQRQKLRDAIRREGKRVAAGARRLSQDMRRGWERSAFRRIGRNARQFQQQLSNKMRQFTQSNKLDRKFAEMRKELRRKFDGIKRRQSESSMQRLVRRKMNAGKQERRGVRDLERSMRRRNEATRERRQMQRVGRDVRRTENKKGAERRMFDRLGRRVRRDENKALRATRKTGKSLRNNIRRSSSQNRERREMQGVRKLIRRDARRDTNRRRAQGLNNKIRRDFQKERKTERRQASRGSRTLRNFENRQRNARQMRRVGKTMNRDGRRVTRAVRREDKAVKGAVRRNANKNSQSSLFRDLGRQIGRVVGRVRKAAHNTADQIRRDAQRVGRNFNRFVDKQRRTARRGAQQVTRNVRQAADQVRSTVGQAVRQGRRVVRQFRWIAAPTRRGSGGRTSRR